MKNKDKNNLDTKHEITAKMQEVFNTATEIAITTTEKIEGTHLLKEFMEKEALLSKADTALTHRSRSSRVQIIASPYIKFVGYIHSRRIVSVALAFAIVLIFTSSTAYAAQNALPGDILYPIKTNVNEKIESALAFTPTAKAEIAVRHVATRINEIEKLQSGGRLNGELEAKLSRELREQSLQTKEQIDELKKNSSGNTKVPIDITIADLNAELEQVLVFHGSEIDAIVEKATGRSFVKNENDFGDGNSTTTPDTYHSKNNKDIADRKGNNKNEQIMSFKRNSNTSTAHLASSTDTNSNALIQVNTTATTPLPTSTNEINGTGSIKADIHVSTPVTPSIPETIEKTFSPIVNSVIQTIPPSNAVGNTVNTVTSPIKKLFK